MYSSSSSRFLLALSLSYLLLHISTISTTTTAYALDIVEDNQTTTNTDKLTVSSENIEESKNRNNCQEICVENGLKTAVGACNNQRSGKAIQACANAHSEGVTIACNKVCEFDASNVKSIATLSSGSSANTFCSQYKEDLPKPLVYKGCIQGFNKGYDGAKGSFIKQTKKKNSTPKKAPINEKKRRPRGPTSKRIPREAVPLDPLPTTTKATTSTTSATLQKGQETQLKKDIDQIVIDAKAIPDTAQKDVEKIVDDAKSIGPMVVDDLEKIANDVRDIPKVAKRTVQGDIDQFMEDVHNIAPMMKEDANTLAKEMKELPDPVLDDVDTLKKDAKAVPDKVHEDIDEMKELVEEDVNAMKDLVDKQVDEVKLQVEDMKKAVDQLVDADKKELEDIRIVKKKETLEKDIAEIEEYVTEFKEDLKTEVKDMVEEDKKIVEGMVKEVKGEIQNDVHPVANEDITAAIDVREQMKKENEEVSKTS